MSNKRVTSLSSHTGLTRKKSGNPGVRADLSPGRDWKFIFFGFLALNLLSIGFHIFLYYALNNGSFFAPEETVSSSVKALDQEKLDNVLGHFERRREELRARLTAPGPVPEID